MRFRSSFTTHETELSSLFSLIDVQIQMMIHIQHVLVAIVITQTE